MANQNIPEDLQQYDTPEARQAYQASKGYQPSSAGSTDHTGVPEDLWSYDTPENRERYQTQRYYDRASSGLRTADNRTFQLTSEQINWVTRAYRKNWTYGHDDLDQEAQAAGYMPVSLYSRYKEKSEYDQWALALGMPSEKDLEKYLKQYDAWKAEYNAAEDAFTKAVNGRKQSERLLDSFYNDVADRLYKAEFNGTQRGSDEWRQIYFDALEEPKYASLKAYSTDLAAAAAAESEAKNKKSKKAKTADATASEPLTQEQIDAIVEDKGYYFPPVPAIGFSFDDFAALYDQNVTKNETDRGYGKVNSAVRDAAAKIRFTSPDASQVTYDQRIPGLSVQTNGFGQVLPSDAKALSQILESAKQQAAETGPSLSYSGSEDSGYALHGFNFDDAQNFKSAPVKLANEEDVSSVCKDLVLSGYSSNDYWSVIGGLTAGSPLSPDSVGPGLIYSDSTQRKLNQYANVIATRYGSDMLRLLVNDASEEELDAFVTRAVSEGATQEIVRKAYGLAVAALGGTTETDTSRNWDGLSYKERKSRDAAFEKRFDKALKNLPTLPAESGWGNISDPEQIKHLENLRAGFDLDKEFKATKPVVEDTREWYEKVWDFLTELAATDDNPLIAASEVSQGHTGTLYKSEFNTLRDWSKTSDFRKAAKAHGYSDWEIDQYFREKSVDDLAPGESWEDRDRRWAEHYREFLISKTTGYSTRRYENLGLESAEGMDAERKSSEHLQHGGRSGSFGGYAFDPTVQYINSISADDLVLMMQTDPDASAAEGAWLLAAPMALWRGVTSYAAGALNFLELIDEDSTTGLAEKLNNYNSVLASLYKHKNQSGFVATVTDAGAELVRMYLVAKTGGVFGKAATAGIGALGKGGAAVATWLSGGTKAAKLVKWAVESVPFVTGAMGSSYAEARAEGASREQAVTYGVLAGAVEGFTEKMGADVMFGKLGNAAIGRVMKSGVSGMLKGSAGTLTVNLIKMAMNAGAESVEEGTSYVLDLLLKKAIYDPSAQFSWTELRQQMGMGALCGAMGLAFQNYGASYVNSMMGFALSSTENLQTFTDFAMKMYGANLGTNGNYVVQSTDADVSKILSVAEWNEAWQTYLDSSNSLAAAQRQYESAVEALDEDDAQKAREVMYWKNQVAAMDPNDAKSANAMVHAMEQLTLAESRAADTEKKNQKLRADARTEMDNAKKRAQNAMDESARKIRDHSRSEIAMTLDATGATSLDSNYDLLLQESEADPAAVEVNRARVEAIDNALVALDALERAAETQKAAKAKLYDAAVSTLSSQYESQPVLAGAIDTVNQLAQAQENRAVVLDVTADELSADIQAAKQRDELRTAKYAAELDQYDSWWESTVDKLTSERAAALLRSKSGEITREEYEAVNAETARQLREAQNVRNDMRDEAALSYAAEGGTSTAFEGLADAMRIEAAEAREKANDIRNAVVRALAFRTQAAALAAVDAIQDGEGVLTTEQREALRDEMNQIVADSLATDEATQAVYGALAQLRLLEQQAATKTESKAEKPEARPQESASETQEMPVQESQDTTPKTSEERQLELDRAVAIGKMFDVDVQIVDDLPSEIAGRFMPGVIQISRDSTNAPMQVLVHELAHYIEGTAAYHQLQQHAFAALGSDPSFNLQQEIAVYRQLYAENRAAMGLPALNDADATTEAKAEIVSRWCEKNLFANEASINKLCASQQSLGKRILNGIQNMLHGRRQSDAAPELLRAEKLYIKALGQAKAFGGAKVERNSVVSGLVAAGMYVDTEGDAFRAYRVRYNAQGTRTQLEELKPNYESPCDGPITTDDIMNHSPIGAFIRLGQEFGTIPAFNADELAPATNLRAIPSEKLSTPAKIINLFTDISNMCLAYGDNQMVWDFIGGYVFSSITSNSDPQYSRTVDYGTICRKTQNLVTAMSEAMVEKGRGLYADEIVQLSTDLAQKGQIDQPCSMCYVFNRWLGLGGYLNRAKVYQDRYAAMTPQEAMIAFNDVQARLDEIVNSGNYAELIKGLAAKHGLDAQTYLDQMAEVSKSFGEKGWVRKQKDSVSKSDARSRMIQIYSQFLEDCAQRYDLKAAKNAEQRKVYDEIQTRMELTDAYGWFTKVLLNEDKNGNFTYKRSVLTQDGKSWALGKDGNATFQVPTDILFNLNASDRFATEYPDVWRFRTSGGSALGKATYGYTDARLGEFTYGASVSSVKSQEVAKAPRYGIDTEKSTSKNQPKNKLSFVNYRGEFASGGKATFVKAMQNVLNQAWLGGDRMQSSSDYTSAHALDYLITAFEMQCLGAPVQTYTKVAEALSFFDAIGASANASLISPGKGYKGTPQWAFNEATGRWGIKPGSAELVFSRIQGVDPDIAESMSKTSNCVQPIVVGMNREHTALVLSSPWITMCIPVHMSGGTVENISARAMAQGDPGLTRDDITDATNSQNDKILTDAELAERYDKDTIEKIKTAREIRKAILSGELAPGSKLSAQLQNYPMLEEMYEYFKQSGAKLKMKSDNEIGVGIYPNEYWDRTSTIENADVNGDRFQEYCEMLGVVPRFSYGNYGEQGNPGDPDYFPGLHRCEGYWKTLIDRKMYNADGTYRTVGPVDISGLTAQMLNGEAPAASGYQMFNAAENANLREQQATATRVGREYGATLEDNAVDAMKAHTRYALNGDVEARLAELRKQYGAMPVSNAETAPGREDVVLPRQTTEDTYVRRAAQTFMRSPNVTDAAASEIGKAVLRGEFNYERQSNEETESRASQRIIDLGGQEAALKHLEDVAKGHAAPNAETVALGEQLILDAMEVGDTNAFEKAVVYTAMLGTAAGQAVQAFSMIPKLSPQGIALYMNKVIDRLNNVEYKKLIEKGKMKPIELTEDQIARILAVKSFAESRQVETEILSEIAQQVPLTVREQLQNWRYLCMLGNVRTNVRNVAGNLAMASMRMEKNVIGSALEHLDVSRGQRLDRKAAAAAAEGDAEKAERLLRRADKHLDRADRTKTLAVGSEARAQMQANKEYAKATLADAEAVLFGGGKDVGLNVMRDQKRMFNWRWLNKLGKTALSPLEIMDRAFLSPQYVNAYAQWMTARGLSGEDMTLRQRNEAMKYAVEEAQRATFRDANWFATQISKIRSRNLATELIVGGLVPFAKTPMNVLRRGVEYSPAGLLQGMTKLYKANTATNVTRAERMQMRAAAIDRMASGLTGTTLMALGMLLRKHGLLSGGDDDDKRASKFFKDMGQQSYSARANLLSWISGKDVSVSIDWLAPLNMPMFMGAAIWDVGEKLSEGEELGLQDVAEPLLSIADPIIEMSMLSGLQSALKTYGSENALGAVATNTLESFAGQFYPTILGQAARTGDLTRRSPDSKHYWIQSMLAKIPYFSQKVKPYVGGYGEEDEYSLGTDLFGTGDWSNYVMRGLEQFVLPGYIKVENRDELTVELARVYEATGVSNFLPTRPSDYRTINLGKDYGGYKLDLTYDEQVEFEKLMRQAGAEALAETIKTPFYAGLPDEDKADLLTEAYQAATKKARADFKKVLAERHQIGSDGPIAATNNP